MCVLIFEILECSGVKPVCLNEVPNKWHYLGNCRYWRMEELLCVANEGLPLIRIYIYIRRDIFGELSSWNRSDDISTVYTEASIHTIPKTHFLSNTHRHEHEQAFVPVLSAGKSASFFSSSTALFILISTLNTERKSDEVKSLTPCRGAAGAKWKRSDMRIHWSKTEDKYFTFYTHLLNIFVFGMHIHRVLFKKHKFDAELYKHKLYCLEKLTKNKQINTNSFCIKKYEAYTPVIT